MTARFTSPKTINPARILITVLILMFVVQNSQSQVFSENQAKKTAVAFFQQKTKLKSGSFNDDELTQRYRSPHKVNNPLHIFQHEENGFVLVSQVNDHFVVTGYSPSGNFSTTDMPDAFRALVNAYEQATPTPVTATTSQLKNTTTGVEPLLDRAGVSLNQYRHEEVGNCPTGCVATAFAQLMAYYQYPDKGQNSHCYTHAVYGELCADFENTTYNWGSMTPEDYELLSFQVAVALDMNFCGGKSGSSPGNINYTSVMKNFFNLNVHPIITDNFYLYNELDHERPVYAAIPGDPSHAVVLDGYDSNGYFHVNFGWGGWYNGYYLLNNSSTIQIGPSWGGYAFGTNIWGPLYFSPDPIYVSEQDSLTLIAIHNSMNGNTGWDITKPVAFWPGVTIMNERVIELRINNQSTVSGGIIAPEIGELTELIRLSIGGNEINGTLPESVFGLTNLRELSISRGSGNLTVTFTEDIGNLTNLENLYITHAMEGALPASIGNLTKLKFVNLTPGNLTGTIPEEFGQLVNIHYLDLSQNNLSGQIPQGIVNMSGLKSLNLSNNQLTGSLPASMGTFDNLAYLFLQNNELDGSLPDDFGELLKIEALRLQNNAFTGTIPAGIGNLSNLTFLNIRNNKFSALPNETGRLNNLESMDIGNNEFVALPDSIVNLPLISKFVADSNQIAHIPANFGAWPELTWIDMSYNQLTKFPDELCNLTRLSIINFRENRITKLPASFKIMPALSALYLDYNEISSPLPESILSDKTNFVYLNNNRFSFSDIPESEKLYHGLGKQKEAPLKTNLIKANIGDTITIDIREISHLSHPDNEYHWFEYPEYLTYEYREEFEGMEPNPVLTVIIDEQTADKVFYCKVLNSKLDTYTSYSNPVVSAMRFLNTETLAFSIYTHDELLEEKYPESHIISSDQIGTGTISNKEVVLVSPFKRRGNITWQVSQNTEEWTSLSPSTETYNQVVSMNDDELVLNPQQTAYYRCMLTEGTCDPLISEPLLVKSPGSVIFDAVVNVSDEPLTIAADSIEVTIPAQLSDNDFRLTIVKLDNPPPAPEGHQMGSVYDVTISLGTVFKKPLVIKLRNIDLSGLDLQHLPNYKPVFFDEKQQAWVPYTEGGITLEDNSIEFKTSHLTKLGWWEFTKGSFTHRHIYERAEVIYKYDVGTEDNHYMLYEMDWKNETPAWRSSNTDPNNNGAPLMVQDVAGIMDHVMDRFVEVGLMPESDSKFMIYLSANESGALGHIGVGGYTTGYFSLNSQFAFSPTVLMQTIAHEYMHYAQSKYMPVLLDNFFFAEAHAPLADWIVWGENEHGSPEPLNHLSDALWAADGNKSIYDLLGNSWDGATFFPVLEKFTSNPSDANTSGAFLHYMRSYREVNQLDPVKLLKDVWSLQSVTNLTWRNYLNGQTKEQLETTVGQEYDDYVRYLLSGVNKDFTILNQGNGNPLSNVIKNAGPENNGTFSRFQSYFFEEDNHEPQTDSKTLSIPYLASKVMVLSNQTPDQAVVVQYKREHEPDAEHRVYQGRYDLEEKQMVFHDITDSATYSLFLDARSEKATREYQNQAFLLFVNQKCPSAIDFSSNFNASFELKATPIQNIDAVGYANITDKSIHNYSDGQKRAFIITGRMDMYLPGYDYMFMLRDYNRKKTMANDSAYQVELSFTEEMIIENGPDMPTTINVQFKRQTIKYNFISGTLEITQHRRDSAKWGAYYNALMDEYHEGYTNQVVTETQSLKLKDVFLFEPKNIDPLGDVLEFKTGNTTQTKAVLEDVEHSYSSVNYNANGEVTDSNSANYEGTDFSDAVTITLWLLYQ